MADLHVARLLADAFLANVTPACCQAWDDGQPGLRRFAPYTLAKNNMYKDSTDFRALETLANLNDNLIPIVKDREILQPTAELAVQKFIADGGLK